MRAYDSNGDNVINALDTVFNNLLVWQDKNQNGFSEVTELQSLTDHGITSISLNDTPTNTTLAGHTISSTSTFVKDRQTHEIADIWFEQDVTNTLYMKCSVAPINSSDMPAQSRGNLLLKVKLPDRISCFVRYKNNDFNNYFKAKEQVWLIETHQIRLT